MEKTPQEIEASVLAFCDNVCPDTYKPYIDDDGCVSIWRKLKWNLEPYFEVTASNETTVLGVDATNWKLFYRLLGLDKRDALEAERAFWTASTDSLTKSLEAEKVKNANGGEFKDMLQQVLNHSNRSEMDDAQFRMFARENINHLLYGNKEGKKDE